MSEFTKFATSAGDHYLATLAEMQENFLKSLAPMQQMAAALPAMPKMPQMPQMPAGLMPELPTLAEVSEANFAFAQKLLKQQKKFADKFFAATSPEESK